MCKVGARKAGRRGEVRKVVERSASEEEKGEKERAATTLAGHPLGDAQTDLRMLEKKLRAARQRQVIAESSRSSEKTGDSSCSMTRTAADRRLRHDCLGPSDSSSGPR